jgi:phosphoribosylformimino-5-aminoimidazole carboxamide ribotide isomerase
MLQGPALDLYTDLQAKYPDIIFTVSGGISAMSDIERLNALGLKRVIVGKAIYEGRIQLADINKFINTNF